MRQREEKRADNFKAALSEMAEIYELETTASTYIRRIDVDWKKYYLVDPIIDMDITKFTKASLREWALIQIREK